MRKKSAIVIFNKIKIVIFSNELKSEYKVSKEDFTRKRKQDFPLLILFMMNFLKKSLSLEIENFTSLFKSSTTKFSKSAFVQARKKIKPQVFEKLSQLLVNEFYTDNELAVKLWKGYRLLAVDGSRVTLPITKELKTIYGETKNQSSKRFCRNRC